MTDIVDAPTRSRIMSRVRSKDTAAEMTLRRALWADGIRGWRCNVRSITGTPDLAWAGRKIAIFVDSAWWHGHPSRWQPGKLSPWWDAKIERNRERDREVNRALESDGWTIIRIWDFELQKNLASAVRRVREALRS